MRGRVRAATTASTTTWEMKLLGSQGQVSQSLPMTAVNVVATNDSQSAPTGRTRVSSTGTSASSAQNRAVSPSSLSARPTSAASTPRAATVACGAQAAYSFRRPGRRRATGPSTDMGSSGR